MAAKPISVLVLTLLPEAVWNDVVSVAIGGQMIFTRYALQHRWCRSVSLCGLPLHG